MSDYDYAQPERSLPRSEATAINEIDEQLERLEKTLEVLRHRLDPVLSRYEMEKTILDQPREEPASPIRGRANRLRDLNSTLDRLISQFDI